MGVSHFACIKMWLPCQGFSPATLCLEAQHHSQVWKLVKHYTSVASQLVGGGHEHHENTHQSSLVAIPAFCCSAQGLGFDFQLLQPHFDEAGVQRCPGIEISKHVKEL